LKLCFIGNAGHVNLISWIRYYAETLGHDIDVVTFNPPCEDVNGVRFHVLNGRLMQSKWRYVAAIPAIRRLIRRIRPELVIGYRINSYGLLAVASGFRPLVLVAQGNDLWEPALQTAISRYTARRADMLQTWAPHMTRKLIELGGRPERILTLPKGIDTGLFTPGSAPAPDPIVVSTRQFRPEYRHEIILEAIATAKARVTGLKYIACGDGPCRDQLHGLAAELGIASQVEFHGRVNHEDLPLRLRRAQVYVSVIAEDGVSASLLEAMACGAFPIVPDVEPNRDWIRHGSNGFLVPPHDPRVLADRIVEALNDAELRHAARAINVRAIADRASMAANMREMERSYRALVPERAGAHA
jgi:glycosyltransferase involved in cell wall biosynthesis